MRISISILLLLLAFNLSATHNRAGEITFIRIGDLTIQARVSTYTDLTSPANRDSLELCWGDNNCEFVIRANGPDLDGNGIPDGEGAGNGFKFNTYIAVHTYASLGDYTLSMEDPNRNEGIINVNPPNSGDVSFYLKNEFSLLASYDYSPVLLEKPIDIGFVGQSFYHTPNAYDQDGDSLAYRLVTPFGDNGDPIVNYLPLTDFGSGEVIFDEETGLLKWDSPEQVGEYVVTMEIISYRDGIQIGSLIRDMSFIISGMQNMLPDLAMTQFMPNDFTTVEVGQIVQFLVVSEDLENADGLDLTVTSGLYDPNFPQPPVFTIFFENDVVAEANFLWEVTAEHVRDQPYQVVFKVADDLGLANYVVLRFKVVDMLTDVPSILDLKPVTLFPNPSSGYLFVSSEDLFDQPYEIWNEVGQVVGKGRVRSNGEIDIVGIRYGMYIVKFENGGVGKFVRE